VKPEAVPLIIALLVFLSSLISLKVGLSVAIIEILLGAGAGALGLRPEEWMTYLSGFGGILLTFLAGTEIDTQVMREQFKESFLIGVFSFLLPFAGVTLYVHLVDGWELRSALIAGTALSTTSLAVVYSVLVETGLTRTAIGKLILAATFVTDMGTALALSLLFARPTVYMALFVVASLTLIVLATRYSHLVFGHPILKNKVIEPEIKYVFVLLFVCMYFARLGGGHAVLPAFVLGLLMSRHFAETADSKVVRNRLRTVAYAVVTPMFFLVGGMQISLPLIASAVGLFCVLFALKLVTKFLGVYFLARRFIPQGSVYTTLLMSTGLTFGTISSLFGLQAGLIDQTQYSVLVGVVVASAVLPTFVAQKWFLPVHSEDLVEFNDDQRSTA
jgi:Kef-type K+ transport system membrane component KefB